jgi:hypothetical protein
MFFNIKYLSSDVDWCESNFTYCNEIAEMWNSLTSTSFAIFGIYGLYKMPIYNRSVFFFFLNNIFIGITSVLFHSTLSIEGQIMDEFSILFYAVCGIIYLEKYNEKYKKQTIIALLLVPLAVYIYPIMNRLLLLLVVAPYVLYLSKKNSHYLGTIDSKILNIILNTRYYFGLSVVCWVIDYLCFLPFGSHFIWHVLIAFVCYSLTVILQIVAYNRMNMYKNTLHIEYTKLMKIIEIPYLEFDEIPDIKNYV